MLKKNIKEEFIETDINTFKYDILIKVAITFNVLGEIKDVEFDRYNNFLTKRDKKKIRNYILENQPTFNVCWNNMNDLRKFLKAGVDINTIREAFYINLYRNDLWNNEYGMRVVFPGYITQEFYEKYLKGLK